MEIISRYEHDSGEGRSQSHVHETMVSPQKDGWNHIRLSSEHIRVTKFKVGDRIDVMVGRERGVEYIIIVADPRGKTRVKKYAHGNGMQISFREDKLSTNLERGRGAPLDVVEVKPGKLTAVRP